MSSLIYLRLCKKILDNRYDVTFVNGKSITLTTGKFILFRPCDEVSEQTFFVRPLGVVRMVQYFKLCYRDPH